VHPAPSIIIFSTLSGAGFGLIAFLSLLPPAATLFPSLLSSALAVALCTAGLISSTFHLGRPERAWRALTQWRSSWLSREGILALATLTSFSGLVVLTIVRGRAVPVVGIVPATLAACSVYATGMIYASLRSVPAWHHPLTPWTYLAFSAASGSMLSVGLSLAFGAGGAGLLSWAALAFLVLAWALKIAWWLSARRQRFGGSTPESATGLGRLAACGCSRRPTPRRIT
jgi:DMSO reductase anchor subunit